MGPFSGGGTARCLLRIPPYRIWTGSYLSRFTPGKKGNGAIISAADLAGRSPAGRTQTLKGREARIQNALTAFYAPFPEILEGCRILLIDDVLTTGATLEGCGRALQKAGTEVDLYIATMAVVP